MNKIGKIIKQVRLSQKKTLAQVADDIKGYDAGNLSRFESGKQDIASDKLEMIVDSLGLKMSELYSLAENNSQLKAEQIPASYGIQNGNEIKGYCPVVSWVQAGAMCDPGHVFEFSEAEDWRACPINHSNKTYVLVVSSTSMEPDYIEGCDIFVDPEMQAQHNDDVIVRDSEGKATFKRLKVTPEGSYLIALNPDYPERIIKVPPDSTICGVVIYSGKKRR